MTAPTPAGSGALAFVVEDNRLAICGEIRTPAEREALWRQFDEILGWRDRELHGAIVVDIEHAKYLDVATWTVLLQCARRCYDRGLQLQLTGANEEQLELLRVTTIDQRLRTHGATITARPAA